MPNYFGRAVFVGGLPQDVRESELEDLFFKFGKIVGIDIKAPSRPPAFAFVEFEDPRDAEDAARARDGVDFLGGRIRVEVARGGDKREERRRPVNARSTGFRVVVKGLPPRSSWQDLKDHFRKYAPPVYTDVQHGRDGSTGVVEFETYDDMKYAIRKLDDSEFTNAFEKGGWRIQVYEDSGRGGKDSRDSRDSRDNRDRGGRYREDDRDRRQENGGRERARSRSPRRQEASRSRSPLQRRDNRDASPAPARSPRRDSRDASPAPARSPRRDSRDPSPAPARSRSPEEGGRQRSRSLDGPQGDDSPRRSD